MKLRYPGYYLLPCLILFFISCSGKKDEPDPIPAGTEIPEVEIVIEEPELEPLPPSFVFRVKTGPSAVKIFMGEQELIPLKTEAGVRQYALAEDTDPLLFQADKFITQKINPREIPGKIRRGILQIKLEPESGIFHLEQEIPTGNQPKSVCFSGNGNKIFVPLLNETGVDVFNFSPGTVPAIQFEKRISLPDGKARGFVEPYIDANRNEFLVSNMDENKVHIFDMATLEYKTSVNTGGTMPKVITQNPEGSITAVSNWLSNNISLIDPETRKIITLVPVGSTPRGMSFSPDGKILYAALFDGPVIGVIDMGQKKLVKTFTYNQGTGAARHVLFHDQKLYVSDMALGRIYILNADDGKVLKSVRVGSNLNTICFSPDKRILFVSSRGKNNPDDYTLEGPEFGTVTALNTEDLSTVGQVWGRNQPTGLAVSPDGKYLVFTDFLDANLELYRINQ